MKTVFIEISKNKNYSNYKIFKKIINLFMSIFYNNIITSVLPIFITKKLNYL